MSMGRFKSVCGRLDVAGTERVGLAKAIAHDLQRLGDPRTVVRMPGQPCCGAQ